MNFESKVKLTNIDNHFVDLNKIGRKSIIVDAGAGWGTFIRAFRKFNRDARFIAIEPCQSNIKELREKEFIDCELYSMALVGMGIPDRIIFTEVLGRKESGNILDIKCEDRFGTLGIKNYEIDTIKINNIFKILDIDRIDFLKMDIEGAEVEILKTMSQETASGIKQMSIEVHTNQTGFTINVAIEALEKLGYAAWQVRSDVYAKRKK